MIVSISLGEDIEVTLDDDCAGQWHPVRAQEMAHHAVTVLTETLAACKASSTRTVRAKRQ